MRLTYIALAIFVMSIQLSTAMTLDELIFTYDFSFDSGTINVTNFYDYMSDLDGNNINDTLFFNLSVDGNFSGPSLFYVDLIDNKTRISQESNVSLYNSTSSLLVNFSTGRLNNSQYNYSVRVYDENDTLIFRKDRLTTDIYESYEQGNSIILISDENINNEFVRINVSLNITISDENVTVYLEYNDSAISSFVGISLGAGSQLISIDFDNQTIKKTHYVGTYSINKITVGSQDLLTNYTTATYNYEDFATTSYLQSYTAAQIDTNANNFSEFLELNTTAMIKTSANYSIYGEIYDVYNTYVTNISRSAEFSTGTNIIQFLINGTAIYASRIDGPYQLSYALLQMETETVDTVYNPYTTSVMYYSDFERPPRPDLSIDLNTTYDSINRSQTINVSIENQGESDAYDFFIDAFDNDTYSNKSYIDYLGVGNSTYKEYTIENNSNTSMIAVVDLNNEVDESNESNNVVNNIQVLADNIDITNLSSIYSAGTHKIFEFEIVNTGGNTLNLSWNLDLGDGNIANSSNSTILTSGESFLIYFEYNYSSEGSYIVNLTAISDNINISKTMYSSMKDLEISNLSAIHYNTTLHIFEFLIGNNKNLNLTNITWSFDTGELIINSFENATLESGANLFVYVEHNYSEYKDYSVTATGTDGLLIDSMSAIVELNAWSVTNLSVLSSLDRSRIFEFMVLNRLSANTSLLSWDLDTGEGILNSTNNSVLSDSERIFTIIEYNYTAPGTYYVNASAFNETIIDADNITIVVG